jgi:hypothetical protein
MKGRWGVLALAGAVVVSMASPAAAMPLWRGAQSGMDHDAVRKLFPGAGRPDTVLKLAGPNVGDLAAPVILAGHPAQAAFYFTKDALWDVVVTVGDPGLQTGDAGLEIAKAVAGQIDEDLGQKRHCEISGEAGARRYDCAWPAFGNRLAHLTYAEAPAGPPLLSIVFRPARLQDALDDGAADINAANTRVKDDAFSQTIEFDGPVSRNQPLFGDWIEFGLRSWMDRSTRTVEHQLYVDIEYQGGSQRHYEWAADNAAESLSVVKIDHSQTRCKDCQRSETVGIALQEAKLIGGLTQPYAVKLSAKSSDTAVMTIGTALIRGQLLAIAAHGGPPAPGADEIVDPTPLDFGATMETPPAKPNRPAGAKVDAVADSGVAAASGLRGGDLIVGLDGATVGGEPAARSAIAAIPPGRRVLISILRGNRPLTLQAQF